MDGLLFDTEVLYQEAIQLAAAEGGHEVAIDVFNRTVGLPWAQSRAATASHAESANPAERALASDAARSDARFGRSAEAGSTNPQLCSPRASAGMCGGIRAHVEMELVRKPESSRMRRKSVSKRKLIFQVPMVRIHFPPARSLRTISSEAAKPRGVELSMAEQPRAIMRTFYVTETQSSVG
jgi:hypothetical protein